MLPMLDKVPNWGFFCKGHGLAGAEERPEWAEMDTSKKWGAWGWGLLRVEMEGRPVARQK